MTRAFMTIAVVFSLAGCATSFTGEAHVEGGPAGCARKCAAWNEDFVGMVAMGEYSDACVCRVRGGQVSQADTAAVAGAATGVVLQMRRAQERAGAATLMAH
jgi:hypothetical protein